LADINSVESSSWKSAFRAAVGREPELADSLYFPDLHKLTNVKNTLRPLGAKSFESLWCNGSIDDGMLCMILKHIRVNFIFKKSIISAAEVF